MGNPKAFLTIPRQEAGYRPIHDRINDFSEVEQTLNTGERKLQASRCMDCGVPFCHWACPLGNRPPEFQDALWKGDWRKAYEILTRTNDFPEFTGRVCPALCEQSCVLKLRLNRRGFEVTVYEKDEYVGGLLRFGIPNFKLNKPIIDRRIHLMEAEGITFRVNQEIDLTRLPEGFDAYCLCTGTPQARDLAVPGRELAGIHFALEMLAQQNRVLAGQTLTDDERITARDKHVLVIGGGDTGSDCIGTANRQGAKSVTQIEIMPQPPVGYNPATPWPQYPRVLKTSSSHEEGCTRRWSLSTVRFIGEDGHVRGAEVEEVEWQPNPDGGRSVMKPTGRREVLEADLVLLAMGFLKPELPPLPANVWVAGDAATGPSLVVRCIAAGRRAAEEIGRAIL